MAAGRRRRRRRSIGKKQISFLTTVLLLLLGTLAGKDIFTENADGRQNSFGQEQFADAAPALSEGSRLQVHYLDVGQGDATLIVCGDAAMLIDAGNNSRGDEVVEYLESQGVEDLDYVIGTHPDADHIGGLDVVLSEFDCGTILMPDCEKDTQTYQDVVNAMEQKDYVRTLPVAGNTYPLGDAAFTVVSPLEDYGADMNSASVGLLLQHGENRFLFTGDAEEKAEEDMLAGGMDLSADVYKAAHHGSDTANTEAFLDAVSPAYAVISCGEDNSYGHPHAEVLNRLRAMGVQVFRTDEQGTVVASSDGTAVTFNMAPDESWKAGERR